MIGLSLFINISQRQTRDKHHGIGGIEGNNYKGKQPGGRAA